MDLPAELRDLRYCYLTTHGRVTDRRHTAELWYVPHEAGVFLMSGSGGLTQWCLNLQADDQAVLRIDRQSWLARVAFLGHDDPARAEVLQRFHEKYDPEDKNRLPSWLRAATVVRLVFTRALTD